MNTREREQEKKAHQNEINRLRNEFKTAIQAVDHETLDQLINGLATNPSYKYFLGHNDLSLCTPPQFENPALKNDYLKFSLLHYAVLTEDFGIINKIISLTGPFQPILLPSNYDPDKSRIYHTPLIFFIHHLLLQKEREYKLNGRVTHINDTQKNIIYLLFTKGCSLKDVQLCNNSINSPHFQEKFYHAKNSIDPMHAFYMSILNIFLHEAFLRGDRNVINEYIKLGCTLDIPALEKQCREINILMNGKLRLVMNNTHNLSCLLWDKLTYQEMTKILDILDKYFYTPTTLSKLFPRDPEMLESMEDITAKLQFHLEKLDYPHTNESDFTKDRFAKLKSELINTLKEKDYDLKKLLEENQYTRSEDTLKDNERTNAIAERLKAIEEKAQLIIVEKQTSRAKIYNNPKEVLNSYLQKGNLGVVLVDMVCLPGVRIIIKRLAKRPKLHDDPKLHVKWQNRCEQLVKDFKNLTTYQKADLLVKIQHLCKLDEISETSIATKEMQLKNHQLEESVLLLTKQMSQLMGSVEKLISAKDQEVQTLRHKVNTLETQLTVTKDQPASNQEQDRNVQSNTQTPPRRYSTLYGNSK